MHATPRKLARAHGNILPLAQPYLSPDEILSALDSIRVWQRGKF